ncbi:unnamed protein product, partial [marine sediment metagenome]
AQGFVPTHRIDEIRKRVHRAVLRGARRYLIEQGHPQPAESIAATTFEKLHNDAFEGDPNAPAVELAVRAAELCGMRQGSDGDILGFKVSCDARLFAHEYPGMTVLTAGAGRLNLAHSDEEQIDLEE